MSHTSSCLHSMEARLQSGTASSTTPFTGRAGHPRRKRLRCATRRTHGREQLGKLFVTGDAPALSLCAFAAVIAWTAHDVTPPISMTTIASRVSTAPRRRCSVSYSVVCRIPQHLAGSASRDRRHSPLSSTSSISKSSSLPASGLLKSMVAMPSTISVTTAGSWMPSSVMKKNCLPTWMSLAFGMVYMG